MWASVVSWESCYGARMRWSDGVSGSVGLSEMGFESPLGVGDDVNVLV